MKKLLLILALLWGGGAVGVWYWVEARGSKVSYRSAAVRRGDLRATIVATGTMEPERVVDVDAQVAGQVREFGADPGDPARPIGHGSAVEPGTVLAQIDPALFRSRVDQAKGSLAKAEADVAPGRGQAPPGRARAGPRQTAEHRRRSASIAAAGAGLGASPRTSRPRRRSSVNQGAVVPWPGPTWRRPRSTSVTPRSALR